MAERQSQPISPPLNVDKESLSDYSAILQDNFTQLFQIAHRHKILTSAPASNEGNVGDIFLVESGGTFSLYAKFSSGWKSVALT